MDTALYQRERRDRGREKDGEEGWRDTVRQRERREGMREERGREVLHSLHVVHHLCTCGLCLP